MVHRKILSLPWLSGYMLLVIPLVKEASGWLVQPTCSTRSRLSTCSRCRHVQVDAPRVRRQTLLRVPSLWVVGQLALNANTKSGTDEGSGGDNAAGGAGGGVNRGGAAAPAPARHLKPKGKQERVQAAEDSDAPILYIKGLKEGGGVGVWGNRDNDDDNAGGDDSRVRGGNAAMMARALRNAQREIEGGSYEEGVEEGEVEEVEEEAANQIPVWEKVQAALGLGFWSYVGLGLAVFIIVLNNVLGVGWAMRIMDPEYDPDIVLDTQQQGRQIQYMPLDDASNLLLE